MEKKYEQTPPVLSSVETPHPTPTTFFTDLGKPETANSTAQGDQKKKPSQPLVYEWNLPGTFQGNEGWFRKPREGELKRQERMENGRSVSNEWFVFRKGVWCAEKWEVAMERVLQEGKNDHL